MSVTMEFFDGITFDIAKQKYYNANKVDARMEEIKAAFAELIEENKLDDFNVAQATQIFRIKQALMGIALDK